MVDIDTSNIRSAGNDIISLTNEINELMNNTFELIDSAPWEGESANSFKADAKIDKINYIRFVNDLRKYGKFLVDYADNMENIVTKVRK